MHIYRSRDNGHPHAMSISWRRVITRLTMLPVGLMMKKGKKDPRDMGGCEPAAVGLGGPAP